MNVLDFEVDSGVDLNMSSLQGYVSTTYEKLVDLFGAPTYSDADPNEKVNAEWLVEAKVYDPEDDDSVYVKFSIYNWKTGNVPVEEYNWHVGGFDNYAPIIANQIVNG